MAGVVTVLAFLSGQEVNDTGWPMRAVQFRVAAGQTVFTQEITMLEANIGRFPVGVVFTSSHGASVVLLLDDNLKVPPSVDHHS